MRALPLLVSLAEKSLVRAREGVTPRFEMLQTIHDFAGEKLGEAGGAAAALAAATRYFTELAARADHGIRGSEFHRWLDLLDAELPNVRPLLEWCERDGHAAEGLKLAAALGWFWFRRGHFAEGDRWLELFLDAAGDAAPAHDRARGLYYLSWVRRMTGIAHANFAEPIAFCLGSARLAAGCGDPRLHACALAGASAPIAVAGLDGVVFYYDGVPRFAVQALALARDTDDAWTVARCLIDIVDNPFREATDLPPAVEMGEEAVRLAERTGDPFLVSQALSARVFASSPREERADLEPQARAAYKEAVAAHDTWCRLRATLQLAATLRARGDLEESARLGRDALRLSVETGARGWMTWTLGWMQVVAHAQVRMKRSARLMAAAIAFVSRETHPEQDPRMPGHFGMSREELDREWAVGWSMTLEQAVAYALSDED